NIPVAAFARTRVESDPRSGERGYENHLLRGHTVQPLNLFLKHLGHLASRDPDGADLQAQRLRGLRTGLAFQGRHDKGLPGLRLHAEADARHGFLHQLALAFRVQLAEKVLTRVRGGELREDLVGTRRARGSLPRLEEVAPDAVGDGAQPGTEAPRGLVLE